MYSAQTASPCLDGVWNAEKERQADLRSLLLVAHCSSFLIPALLYRETCYRLEMLPTRCRTMWLQEGSCLIDVRQDKRPSSFLRISGELPISA